MPDRFFCSPIPDGDLARLEGPESHHLSRVLRKNVGEQVELFDGRGQFALAEILTISKKAVELSLLDHGKSPEPIGNILLASAVPKGDRYRFLIEKAVELGVDAFMPLITERSVVKPGEGKRDKMEQAVVEASKQCRRNWLMAVHEPMTWEEFLKEHSTTNESQKILLAHPTGRPLREQFSDSLPDRLILLTGPEGGFTEEEVSRAIKCGAVPVGLGPHILRIETAALTLAAFAAMHRLPG